MSFLSETLQRIKKFLDQDLWEIELVDQRWWRRLILHQGQVLTLVVRDFIADQCLLRASALTFATLLSIVPLLALMFAVLKGFGVRDVLEPLLLSKLAVGSGDVVNQVIDYINNTNVARLGTVGLVFLIMTVLTLLTNIEKSFNSVWGVEEDRSILRRFTDYFSVVTIGPIFVAVAISMTSTLKSQSFVNTLLEKAYIGEGLLLLFKVLPFMVMWLVFAGLYLFMPNTKVSPRAALIGGIFGGSLWQFSQWAYIDFQVGVARYNAIYGTMAALPILMFWIYLSWMIVLLGLEMTYANQNLRNIRQDIRGSRVNFASRELISMTILVFIGRRFFLGEPALDREQLSAQLKVPPRLLQNILDELERLSLVSQIGHGEQECAYQPAQALETITVFNIFRGLAVDGTDYTHMRHTREQRVVADLAEQINRSKQGALNGLTLKDLVLQAEECQPPQGD